MLDLLPECEDIHFREVFFGFSISGAKQAELSFGAGRATCLVSYLHIFRPCCMHKEMDEVQVCVNQIVMCLLVCDLPRHP